MVGSDLSDHAPAPWVKKNASRHRTDILTESWVFAGLPQVSRETFWRLRESRKRFGKCRGACAACANVSVNAGIPARPAQTSRQMPRTPRGLRKRLGKCREPRATCANVSANAGSPARPAQTSRHGAKDHSQRTPRTYNTAAVALAPTKVATISKRSNPPLRSWSDSYKSTPAVPVSIFR